jgi:hypothetical protein
MKTNNLQADAMTRARQIAAGAIKDQFRSEGRKLSEWRTSDHRSAIAELANDPTIMERALQDVELWCGKNRAPKR